MPTKQPDLPLPAHPDVDSMLSRKFGREVANYFSGSPLNRLGFLRGDHVLTVTLDTMVRMVDPFSSAAAGEFGTAVRRRLESSSAVRADTGARGVVVPAMESGVAVRRRGDGVVAMGSSLVGGPRSPRSSTP